MPSYRSLAPNKMLLQVLKHPLGFSPQTLFLLNKPPSGLANIALNLVVALIPRAPNTFTSIRIPYICQLISTFQVKFLPLTIFTPQKIPLSAKLACRALQVDAGKPSSLHSIHRNCRSHRLKHPSSFAMY